MKFLDQFRRDVVTLEKDAYAELLREAAGLRDDKKRLQADVEKLNLKVEALEKLARAFQQEAHQSRLMTKETVARQLRVPISMIDQIDTDRMGIQFDEPTRKH